MTNEEIYQIIGENVWRYRKNMKYTQKRLAEEAGIDRTAIAKLERGKYLPTTTFLLSISRALNVEFICLFIGVTSL